MIFSGPCIYKLAFGLMIALAGLRVYRLGDRLPGWGAGMPRLSVNP